MTATRRLITTMMACALVVGLGCGGADVKKTTKDDDAVIFFKSPVQDAEVWVNGRAVRMIKELRSGMALSPGTHRIEIRHERYHTYYLELTVEKRERRTIAVKLAQILP